VPNPPSLPDLEAAQALGFLLGHVHALHARALRAFAREGDDPLDGFFVPFDHRFHGPFPRISRPAAHAVLLRQTPERVAEEDALHPTANDQPATDHAGRLTRFVSAEFVARLARERIGETFNFYREGKGASLRRERLGAYLEARQQARLLLVGEAAGYRGARTSGIPFTSERQLSGRGPAEASATIVHRVLAELGLEEDVLLWNLVPTHPHRPGEPDSNRRPTRHEIAAGRPFLAELARGRRVVAVGRLAARELGAPYVRHPSHGGAVDFRDGLVQSALGGRAVRRFSVR
jgi:uracil-DNA glycosylase family 4